MSTVPAETSRPSLTPQQEQALSVSSASVALSAGAGCGKTSVLTERFLRYLDGPDRRPLSSIVALTFTDKAATELRGRVREACRKKLDAGLDHRHWKAVLRGLEAAPIGTFHAFCGNLLRRFPIEAGVEPGFRVLEESIAPSLLDLSLASTLRGWLADRDPDLETLAVAYGLSAVRDALRLLVSDHRGQDYDLWASRSVEEILQTWHSFWLSDGLPRALLRVVEAAEPALRLFALHRCSNRVMQDRIAFLQENIPQLPQSRDPQTLLDQILDQARVQGAGGKNEWPSEDVFESIKKALTKLRTRAKDFATDYAFNDEIDRLSADHALRFARLASIAVRRYALAKAEQSYLDFDDLLLKTLDLLRQPDSPVLHTLQEEISVLLVDEFQDTDPIQAEILDLLCGENAHTGGLFLVGDTKQSIYRFRGAEPELFRKFRERFPAEGQKNLTANFRSAPSIIHFVNALFEGTEGFSGEEHLLSPSSSKYAPTDAPAVEFLWAFDPALATYRGRIPAPEARRLEAQWIARRLSQIIHDQTPIWDEKTESIRPVQPGDVVLLLRSLNDAAAYEHALVESGLDYYLVGGSAFFAQQEVLDLINLLSVIEDPLDEIALAGVLRSPFFGLSDEALYWLAQKDDLATGLAQFDRLHDLSEPDREAAERAHHLLTRWRSFKDRLPIASLIDRALSESGYEAAILAEHLGDRKRANTRKLVRQARRFDDAGLSLSDLVTRLRADLRKPPREEQAATTDEEGDAIRIMSIHQAKGLEFPVVVVPDLDRKTPPPSGHVVYHPQLGLIVKPSTDSLDDDTETDDSRTSSSKTPPSVGWSTFRAIEHDEEQREALRILYVAATRARERLILSAGTAFDASSQSPALRLLTSRFNRQTGQCEANLPADWPAPPALVILEPPPLSSSTRKTAQVRPRLLSVARRIEDAPPTADSTPRIRQNFPTWIDLNPLSDLAPARAPLLRLLQQTLQDPQILRTRRFSPLVERQSRLLVPTPSLPVQTRAAAVLSNLLRGNVSQGLREASECLVNREWTLRQNSSTILGRIEIACRDASGAWRLIALADSSAPLARERLRLLLSARALAITPLRGWLYRINPDDTLDRLVEESFDDATLTRAWDDWLAVTADLPKT